MVRSFSSESHSYVFYWFKDWINWMKYIFYWFKVCIKWMKKSTVTNVGCSMFRRFYDPKVLQYWFHKICNFPGASPARQAQNWLRPAHEMGSSPHSSGQENKNPTCCTQFVWRLTWMLWTMCHLPGWPGSLWARQGDWPHSASSKQLWMQ